VARLEAAPLHKNLTGEHLRRDLGPVPPPGEEEAAETGVVVGQRSAPEGGGGRANFFSIPTTVVLPGLHRPSLVPCTGWLPPHMTSVRGSSSVFFKTRWVQTCFRVSPRAAEGHGAPPLLMVVAIVGADFEGGRQPPISGFDEVDFGAGRCTRTPEQGCGGGGFYRVSLIPVVPSPLGPHSRLHRSGGQRAPADVVPNADPHPGGPTCAGRGSHSRRPASGIAEPS